MSDNIQQQKQAILDTKKDLIQMLQEYSKSQVELWRQVPELAKEADKLNRGISGRYKMAHSCYLWSIYHQFLHGLQVNLQTGEIQFGGYGDSLEQTALDQIDLVVNLLDAEQVIGELKKGIGILAGDRTRRCQ